MNEPITATDRFSLAEELCTFDGRVPLEQRDPLLGIIGRLMGTSTPLAEIGDRLMRLAQFCQDSSLFRFAYRIQALAIYGAHAHVIDIESGANHEISGADWITAARRIGNSVRSSVTYAALTGAEVGRATVDASWSVTITSGNSTLRIACPKGTTRA